MDDQDENTCVYCSDLERYGLLPAEDVDIQTWMTMSGNAGGGGVKRMHAPRYPVADWKGIECQNQSAER